MTFLGVFLNPEIRTGGHRRYLELISGLAEKSHQIHLIANKSCDFDIEGIVIHKCGLSEWPRKNRSHYITKAVKHISEDLPANKYDGIIVFGETHFLGARFLKKQFRSPLIFAYRSDMIAEALADFRLEKKALKNSLTVLKQIVQYYFYEMIVCKTADKIVFQSEFDRTSWCRRHNSGYGKTYVIGGNIGLPWYKPEYENINRSSYCRTLLFIGSISSRKGLRILIESLKVLRNSCSGLRLIIAGFGPDEKSVQKLISSYGLDDVIDWRGRVSNPFPLYKEADLLVVPSLFDSYPNTILEAIHTGCPAIGSATGGIPDVLVDDRVLVEPGSVEKLTEIIRKLYSDDAFYKSCRRLVKDRQSSFHFNWVEKFESLMKVKGA